MKNRPADNLFTAAEKLAAQRARIELDLVGAIVARPKEGVAVAKAAGLHRDDFDSDDLRLIIIALALKVGHLTGDRDADQLGVAVLSRHGLRMINRWDPSQTAANFGSSVWSNESLAVLFDSQLFHPILIQNLIAKLHSIEHRQREASKAYVRCLDLLENDPADVADEESDNPLPLVAA